MMVNIEIDGKKIQANDGAMVIEAADAAGIAVPRFCYHKKLSVAANCRMCLVEVEKAAKPLPACATPVTEGMKVFTQSRKAIEAQKGVMEFLLINHPLDCPICDQGGECELQDLAMGFGSDHSQYSEKKRVVADKDIGPLIATDMTRCIHCTRCVRFGEEIAGLRELGATGRGEHMLIGTYIQKSVASELSGNVIDLCPVGALTSKPFRFHARSWEMDKRPSVAAHDCVGSNIHVETLRGEVRRVTPKENEEINETWISDRDRFSYEGVNSADRLTVPMIKRESGWQETDWETALNVAVSGLKNVVSQRGAAQLGALVSPSATIEEMYLLQKLMRGIGSSNVDHRNRQLDFSDQDLMPSVPTLGTAIQHLEKADAALLIGSNVRMEQPLIGHRLRKAAVHGGRIMFINPVDYDFRFDVHQKIIADPVAMERALAGIAKALLDGHSGNAPQGLSKLLASVVANKAERKIADTLKAASNGSVLIGNFALNHPAGAALRALGLAIAQLSGAKFGYLTDGANAAGAWIAGAVPHRAAAGKGGSFGLNAHDMLQEKLQGYVVCGLEPEYDCANPAMAMTALKNAEIVVALTAYKSGAMLEYADVLLPIAPFAETSGTYVNVEGRWQSFGAAVAAKGEARPGWKVLRVLGNLFSLGGFDYVSSEDVRDELKRASDAEIERASGTMSKQEHGWRCPEKLHSAPPGMVRIADVPIYALDATVRRAVSLQKSPLAETALVRINDADTKKLGLADGDLVSVKQEGAESILTLVVDNRVASGCAWISAALAGTIGLGANGMAVELKRA
ncbi:MAG: NADH-quinone oxidoreductase subunit G [Gammaproteobacteria bacterium]|nr:NADH-quinone oxidoreductase subunit G [Gammaproteobacteria bacterium]